MLNETVFQYLINFMVRQELPADTVGYTADQAQFSRYRLVIVPSGFFDDGVFGTDRSMPQLPLQRLPLTDKRGEMPPLLFGTPETERVGSTLVVHADVVASAYFMLSRYEEALNPARDEHGRFEARQSLPFRGHFIHRPVVDEYGVCLRGWLREAGVEVEDPREEFMHVFLTHDVDRLTQYRSLRGTCAGAWRALTGGTDRLADISAARHSLDADPLYCFDRMLDYDLEVPGASVCLFVKACKPHHPLDRPGYSLQGEDFKQLLQFCNRYDIMVGLHASYAAGDSTETVEAEAEALKQVIENSPLAPWQPRKVFINRYHYLRAPQPAELNSLHHGGAADCGITDDFSMGYADMAGFRLGTCHAVLCIDPLTQHLGSLRLRPLQIMDGSLSDPKYMNLDEEDAFQYCCDIFEQVRRHNGELHLLWHNSTLAANAPGYHRSLYPRLMERLAGMNRKQ